MSFVLAEPATHDATSCAKPNLLPCHAHSSTWNTVPLENQRTNSRKKKDRRRRFRSRLVIITPHIFHSKSLLSTSSCARWRIHSEPSLLFFLFLWMRPPYVIGLNTLSFLCLLFINPGGNYYPTWPHKSPWRRLDKLAVATEILDEYCVSGGNLWTSAAGRNIYVSLGLLPVPPYFEVSGASICLVSL